MPDGRAGYWETGEKAMSIVQFAKESYAELRKVIWPSKEDVISSVKVVLISTFVVAIVLGFIDSVLFRGMRAIF